MQTTEIRNETYQSIQPDTKNLACKIYNYLSNCRKPMTREEIAQAIHEDPVSVKARITEMLEGSTKYPQFAIELVGKVQYTNSKGRKISVGTYRAVIKQDLFN